MEQLPATKAARHDEGHQRQGYRGRSRDPGDHRQAGNRGESLPRHREDKDPEGAVRERVHSKDSRLTGSTSPFRALRRRRLATWAKAHFPWLPRKMPGYSHVAKPPAVAAPRRVRRRTGTVGRLPARAAPADNPAATPITRASSVPGICTVTNLRQSSPVTERLSWAMHSHSTLMATDTHTATPPRPQRCPINAPPMTRAAYMNWSEAQAYTFPAALMQASLILSPIRNRRLMVNSRNGRTTSPQLGPNTTSITSGAATHRNALTGRDMSATIASPR